MIYECTKRIEFCSAHRLAGHSGMCRHLHGHNYVAEVTARGAIGTDGMVADFGLVNAAVGSWIKGSWDHAILAQFGDAIVSAAVAAMVEAAPSAEDMPRVFWLQAPPTAEVLAEYLLRNVCPDVLGGSGCEVFAVRIWETPNNSAEVRL
jgi:6-pyruvoyltetrahydropterin/6-carboxytetrahydropterin synthase